MIQPGVIAYVRVRVVQGPNPVGLMTVHPVDDKGKQTLWPGRIKGQDNYAFVKPEHLVAAIPEPTT